MNNDYIRDLFPILNKTINGKQIIYFDNAATTQKPISVIEELNNYYRNENSNIHRGVHFLSNYATDKYEAIRKKVASFINASSSDEVIFTRGTTESINLVASSFGEMFVSEDDEIVISAMEHHSNIVPWQLICEKKRAKLKIIDINKTGELLIDSLNNLISNKTKLIAITHISNVLGTINPIKEVISIAHNYNIPVLVDGAQAIAHCKVDVQDLDCDFYCFSGHKMYAPMGIGVLYGKRKYLSEMPPYMSGGEMIKTVSFEKTEFNSLPFKFEAGTPNVGDTFALGKAIDFINSLGYDSISEIENTLTSYCTEQLLHLGFVDLVGTATKKTGVISFLIKDTHPYDVGVILDKFGVAIRTGNHCAEPLMNYYNISGTARASFSVYNTIHEIDTFISYLLTVKNMLS